MKINKSRKSTHSIMGHASFGSVTLIQSGLRFVVPQECLNRFGTISKSVTSLIKCCVTVGDAEHLNELGIEITSA